MKKIILIYLMILGYTPVFAQETTMAQVDFFWIRGTVTNPITPEITRSPSMRLLVAKNQLKDHGWKLEIYDTTAGSPRIQSVSIVTTVYDFDITPLLPEPRESVVLVITATKEGEDTLTSKPFVLKVVKKEEEPKQPLIVPVFVPEKLLVPSSVSISKSRYHLTYSYCSNSYQFQKTRKNKTKFKSNLKRVHAVAGQPFSFEIQEVNPYRYDIALTVSDSSHNEFVPALLQMAFGRRSAELLERAGGVVPHATAGEQVKFYVIEMGNQLAGYIQHKQSQDCIDHAQLQKERWEIQGNIYARFTGLGKLDHQDLRSFVNEKVDIDNDEDSSLIRRALLLYDQFRALTFQPYIYNISQVRNKDEIKFTLSVTPKTGTTGHSFHTDKSEIIIPVHGGFKIDASTGFFYTTLSDRNYRTVDGQMRSVTPGGRDTVMNGQYVRSAGTSKGDFGFAALFHFYPRISNNFNISYNLGAGLTFSEDPALRYFTGLSAIIGRQQRVSVSAGAALGKVGRLKEEYRQPLLYTNPGTLTDKVYRWGAFVTVTYNIPFMSEQEVEAPKKEPAK